MKIVLVRIVFVVFGLLTVTNGFCQKRLRMVERNSLHENKLNVVSIFPLGVLNVLDPSFQIGYDRKVRKNVIIQISGGIILPHSILGVIFFSDTGYNRNSVYKTAPYRYSGYKIAGEAKHILAESSNGRHNYFYSIESFYKKEKNEVYTVYPSYPSGPHSPNIDYFTVHKEVVGVGFKVGKQFFFGRMILEFNSGIGLRYNNVRHTNRDTVYKLDGIDGHIHRQGKYYRLYLPLHIKIGYRF